MLEHMCQRSMYELYAGKTNFTVSIKSKRIMVIPTLNIMYQILIKHYRMVIANKGNIAPTLSCLWLRINAPVGVKIFVWFPHSAEDHVRFAHGDSDAKNKPGVMHS